MMIANIKSIFFENDPDKYVEEYEKFYARSNPNIRISPLTDRTDYSSYILNERNRTAHLELQKDLYNNLNTLDGKASGLITYCGLVLAGSTFLINWHRSASEISSIIIWSTAVSAAISAFLAVMVFYVVWTPIDDLRNETTLKICKNYYSVRQQRTKIYTLSWMMISLSTLLFLLYFGIETASGLSQSPNQAENTEHCIDACGRPYNSAEHYGSQELE